MLRIIHKAPSINYVVSVGGSGVKNRDTFTFFDMYLKSKFNLQALREEEKMRNRVNKRLPKAVEDITNWMDELQKKGKHFRIRGMTFDELNAYQENDHDRKVQEEKERKIEEKKKILVQESIYGVAKTPNRGGNRTLRQVKRLQHESKVVGKTI